jgi:hypothetical protein
LATKSPRHKLFSRLKLSAPTVKLKLGKDMLAYNSIRAHNIRVSAPIGGGGGQALEGMGRASGKCYLAV